MTVNDDHNHFCIYCGAGLEFDQKFCIQCGREVYRKNPPKIVISKYDKKIAEIEEDYNLKQSRAKELIDKLFDPAHMTYNKFLSSINKSNELFAGQLDVTKKMIEVDSDDELVNGEIDKKIQTLEMFIDKMEDLIDEMVIHLSSNKSDIDAVHNLFSDMDDLIDSVKDY